jgi:hypothetical protein
MLGEARSTLELFPPQKIVILKMYCQQLKSEFVCRYFVFIFENKQECPAPNIT